MAVASWAWALALVLLSRPALASTGSEEGAFGGAFASLSATMMATFDLAQSKEDVPLSLPSPGEEVARNFVPPPWMAGFCDARGASGVAPLPALPVQDGTVAAGPSSCQESSLKGGSSIERSKNKGASAPNEASEPAMMPAAYEAPVWGQPRELPRSRERLEALPRGFSRGIEEPPRG